MITLVYSSGPKSLLFVILAHLFVGGRLVI